MPKVSVIIPVYNGEAYLRQCLDTVCAQTLEDIEIICVDDGSIDGSWAILEEYGKRDERFRLLRQENLHVAAARNNGLARAEGKYVIFWDCDDFFEPNALELLYQRAEETGAEICVCNNDLYDNATGKRYPTRNLLNLKKIPEGDTFNRFTNPEHILSFTGFEAWSKLFLRSFLIENDIKFPDYQYGQDAPFTMIALCVAAKIATVSETLIHYRWNNSESLVGESSRLSPAPLERVHAFEYAVDQMIERNVIPMEALGGKIVSGIRFCLQNVTTEEAFVNVLNACTENDPSLLEKSNIRAEEDAFAKHLLHDKPGDLLAFMMHDLWRKNRVNVAKRRGLAAELKETRAKLKAAEKKLTALQNSRSYRLGRALLFIPRKIRDLFRRARG